MRPRFSNNPTRPPRLRAATPPPWRASLGLAMPTAVCDGCQGVGAIGPWHLGGDGAQFCAACHARLLTIELPLTGLS